MRKLWAGTLPLMLIAGGLATAPQITNPASAVAAPATSLSPSNPIKMERFNYYSGQSTAFVRPVVLQKKVGNGWRTIYSGNTGANGRFRFTVHTASVDTLRSYSSAFKYRGKTYPASATAPITVRPRDQRISLSMSSTSSASVATSPGRSGRTVTLQRKSGNSWTGVATARTSASGTATLKFRAFQGDATYRAVASSWNGAPSMFSGTASRNTYRWHYLSDVYTTSSYLWEFQDNAKISGNYYHNSFGNPSNWNNARQIYGYYDLSGRKCTQLKAVIGIDDKSSGGQSTWDFVLDRDGNETRLGTVMIYHGKQIVQNISGVNRVGLIAYRNTGYSFARWGDPQVYCAS